MAFAMAGFSCFMRLKTKNGGLKYEYDKESKRKQK